MGAKSEHFSDRELACHHCLQAGLPAAECNQCTQELVDALESLRAVISAARKQDTPILVNSAYRCPVANAELNNAATQSQHLLGKAADIRVSGMTATDLFSYARQVKSIHGIGRADRQNYLHVDVRDAPARWCYNEAGAQVAWYDPPGDAVQA